MRVTPIIEHDPQSDVHNPPNIKPERFGCLLKQMIKIRKNEQLAEHNNLSITITYL